MDTSNARAEGLGTSREWAPAFEAGLAADLRELGAASWSEEGKLLRARVRLDGVDCQAVMELDLRQRAFAAPHGAGAGLTGPMDVARAHVRATILPLSGRSGAAMHETPWAEAGAEEVSEAPKGGDAEKRALAGRAMAGACKASLASALLEARVGSQWLSAFEKVGLDAGAGPGASSAGGPRM